MRGAWRAQHAQRRLRRACKARLHALGLRKPYSLGDVVTHVSAARDRPVRLLPLALGSAASDGCSGLWVATDTEDWIFVDAAAAGDYGDLILAHELAHILCEHPADVTIGDDELRGLVPTLDPDRVRTALRRTTYDSDVEREAEMLGSLILARAHVDGTPLADAARPPPTSEAAAVLARLSRVLR